ncbi:MAG: CHAT domain-containing protein [bacterium]|nr:CHAT domain-containing protein [bacterium]
MNKSLLILASLCLSTIVFCQPSANVDSANIWHDRAEYFFDSGIFDSATYYITKAEEAYEALELWEKQAVCLNKISNAYWSRRNLDDALTAAQKCLELSENHLSKYHLEKINALGNIGVVHFFRGDYEIAEESILSAINLFELGKHPQSEVNADLYNNLGLVYLRTGKWDDAITYFKKSDYTKRQFRTSYTNEMIGTINNIGGVYWNMKNYEEALKYFLRGKDLRENLIGPDHPSNAYSHNNIGFLYADMGKPEKGIIHLLKAAEIRKKSLGDKHPLLASSYARIGEAYIQMDQLNEALQNFQYSFVANDPNFENSSWDSNPVINEYIDPVVFLKALRLKGNTLLRLYEQDSLETNLHLALSTFVSADTLIDNMRNSHIRQRDKRRVSGYAANTYLGAIITSKKLLDITRDEKYMDKAFYFSEKSRSATLANSLLESQAKVQANLPEKIKKFESELRIDQSKLRSRLYSEKDSIKQLDIQQKLSMTNSRIDSLTQKLEENYPLYFSLKYSKTNLSIQDIKNRLTNNQALIEYYSTPDLEEIYVFLVAKDKSELFVVTDNNIKETISDFRQCLSDFDEALEKPNESKSKFIQSSSQLFKTLFSKVIEELSPEISQVIVSSNGELASFPMELLLKSTPSEDEKYSNMDYLLNSYSVSYTNSASILFQDFSKKESSNNSVLAVAPTYPLIDSTNNLYVNLRSEFRDQLNPLKWNAGEVQQITKILDGKQLTNSTATEKLFKQDAPNYKILHLAMHAFVDHNDPMLSHLVFTPDQDSIEDGMLHIHELINLNLSADLAVLSACNTGIGKIEIGEGPMSLGTAFSYAGCPSTLVSHWAVDDNSTSELMALFYDGLSNGLSKDEALRQAKLEFLKKGDELRSHPAFWGGFVVIGNSSPIAIGKIPLYGYILIVAFSLLVLFFFVKRRFS